MAIPHVVFITIPDQLHRREGNAVPAGHSDADPTLHQVSFERVEVVIEVIAAALATHDPRQGYEGDVLAVSAWLSHRRVRERA